MARKQYECRNEGCTLGDMFNPGRFTGGMSKEQRSLLTGDPEPDPKTYGAGVCPNCGKDGTEVSD